MNENKEHTNKISPIPIKLDSSLVSTAGLSLYIKRHIPITIMKTYIYFAKGYLFLPSKTPKSITGIGLHDLPTT